MQYSGDIIWDDALFSKYSMELVAAGFPPLQAIENRRFGGFVLQKSRAAFALHRLGLEDSRNIAVLKANAEILAKIGFANVAIMEFKKMMDLIGSTDESVFHSNLNKWNPRASQYQWQTTPQQLKTMYKLAIDTGETNRIYNDFIKSSGTERYAEEDLEIFQEFKQFLKSSNKLFGSTSPESRTEAVQRLLKQFTEKRGIPKFVNFPRRVFLKGIETPPFDIYNSDNYQYYDKYYVVKDDTKFSSKSLRLITDKKPDNIRFTDFREQQNKDGSLVLSIDEENMNSLYPLYTLTVDNKYVELKPTFYITIGSTSDFTHPMKNVTESNLDYYHMLFWDSFDLYVALNVFQMGVFGRNKVTPGIHGNVVAVAYTYNDAKYELYRAFKLLSELSPVARWTKYKPSEDLESFMELQREHARDGKNGAEASEMTEMW